MIDERLPDTLTDWLCGAVASLARLPSPPAPDAELGALGLSSLAAVTLQYRLMTEQGITAPLDALAAPHSIAGLAEYLATLRATEDAA